MLTVMTEILGTVRPSAQAKELTMRHKLMCLCLQVKKGKRRAYSDGPIRNS